MIGISILTILFVFGLSVALVFSQMDEISKNFNQYKDNPLVIVASPLLKPANDKRTRMEFASDAMKDAIQNQGSKTFGIFMKPIFQILHQFGSTINTLLNSLIGIRKLFENFFKGMLRIIDPFQRRYKLIIAQLQKTFIELNNSMSKVGGVATAAIYAGISTIRTMMNMFELMKNVSIAILVILVVMVFWFWFILWPIIPLIVIAISMLASSGSGESVSGMASAFCFHPDTHVQLSNKTTKYIKEIRINDKLAGLDGKEINVDGILEIRDDECKDEFYNYKDIIVSGSHIVYEENKPVFVKDSTFAKKLDYTPKSMYCLITSSRKIPVVVPTTNNVVMFADWEELDETDIESLFEWNQTVFETLNKTKLNYVKPNDQTIHSEAGLSYETQILTLLGKQKIHTIKPGMFVYDEKNRLTKVLGVVKLNPASINAFFPTSLSSSSAISNACWIKHMSQENYTQVSTNILTKDDMFVPSRLSKSFWHSETKSKGCLLSGYDNHPWYNLITQSGSFVVADTNIAVRDFSDVGHDRIDSTYDFTINAMRKFSGVC